MLAGRLEKVFSKELPNIDESAIAQNPNQPTRNASANVLSVFSKEVENMIVSSADLANSDKTDGFLKNTHAFKYQDFSGAFFQAGVCELSMAAIMNGMALHCGVTPACCSFFFFLDFE